MLGIVYFPDILGRFRTPFEMAVHSSSNWSEIILVASEKPFRRVKKFIQPKINFIYLFSTIPWNTEDLKKSFTNWSPNIQKFIFAHTLNHRQFQFGLFWRNRITYQEINDFIIKKILQRNTKDLKQIKTKFSRISTNMSKI